MADLEIASGRNDRWQVKPVDRLATARWVGFPHGIGTVRQRLEEGYPSQTCRMSLLECEAIKKGYPDG